MRTKEQIKAYNKEYFSRPEVIARAKETNKLYRERRKQYKKTPAGRLAENRYMRKRYRKVGKFKRLWHRYKITEKDYADMMNQQGGLCAICRTFKDEVLHVDHCHTTSRVRGLLCGGCNRALGLMKDDTTLLLRAIDYLKNN